MPNVTERRLAELAAERKFQDSERINAEDLRRILADFDAIWSSLTLRVLNSYRSTDIAACSSSG
jgi:hypothetical protein